jgi:hypothetical protein
MKQTLKLNYGVVKESPDQGGEFFFVRSSKQNRPDDEQPAEED